jgi:uncharacterized RDD family membrane protein YckC
MNCRKCSGEVNLTTKLCTVCNTKVDQNDWFRYIQTEEYLIDKNSMYPYLAETSKRFQNNFIDSSIITLVTLISFRITLLSNIYLLLTTLCFFAFFYYFVSEKYFGKTIGKYFTNTSVYTREGKLPSNKQLIIRTLSRLIPIDSLSFLISKKPIGIHDLLSKTVVVDDNMI